MKPDKEVSDCNQLTMLKSETDPWTDFGVSEEEPEIIQIKIKEEEADSGDELNVMPHWDAPCTDTESPETFESDSSVTTCTSSGQDHVAVPFQEKQDDELFYTNDPAELKGEIDRYNFPEAETEILQVKIKEEEPNSDYVLSSANSTAVSLTDGESLGIVPGEIKCDQEGMNYNDHVITHNEMPSDSCTHPGSHTNRYTNTRKRRKVEENLFTCSHCGKHFKRKYNLQVHQRVHTGEKPFTCTECGKSFSLKSILKSHQKVHRVEKPFQSRDSGGNSENNDTRTEEKRFKCSECRKGFSDKSSLPIHPRVPTGRNPSAAQSAGKGLVTEALSTIGATRGRNHLPLICNYCSSAGVLGFRQKIK